jgi:hypothetical protein
VWISRAGIGQDNLGGPQRKGNELKKLETSGTRHPASALPAAKKGPSGSSKSTTDCSGTSVTLKKNPVVGLAGTRMKKSCRVVTATGTEASVNTNGSHRTVADGAGTHVGESGAGPPPLDCSSPVHPATTTSMPTTTSSTHRPAARCGTIPPRDRHISGRRHHTRSLALAEANSSSLSTPAE